MSQLFRATGELGARRRKKRVSDGWSFSSSARVRASAACSELIRVRGERACGHRCVRVVGGGRREGKETYSVVCYRLGGSRRGAGRSCLRDATSLHSRQRRKGREDK